MLFEGRKKRLSAGEQTTATNNVLSGGEGLITAGVAAGELAAKYFDKRYNCAQSVLLALSDAFDVEVPDAVLAGSASLAGGIGYAGCTCGALIGASLFIGIASTGRGNPRRNRKATDFSGEFHDSFKERFGSTCCRKLRNGKDFRDKEARKHCRTITVETAEMLADLVASKGLTG